MLRAIKREDSRRVMDVWRNWNLLYLCALLVLSGMGGSAYAGITQGTPLFSCQKPTQGVNTDGTFYTLPASGNTALKEIRWYVDPPALVGGFLPAGTIAKFVVANSLPCSWQTKVGDIGSGLHSVVATAVDNSGAESQASTALSFTVPAASPVGPIAPSGLTVQ